MAFARKSKRKITVGERVFYWVASGNDGWIDLRVMGGLERGSVVAAYFAYHQDRIPTGEGGERLTNQFVITPYVVRQVIEHALAIGWNPDDGHGEVHFGHLDDRIDLRLAENRQDAIRAKR